MLLVRWQGLCGRVVLIMTVRVGAQTTSAGDDTEVPGKTGCDLHPAQHAAGAIAGAVWQSGADHDGTRVAGKVRVGAQMTSAGDDTEIPGETGRVVLIVTVWVGARMTSAGDDTEVPGEMGGVGADLPVRTARILMMGEGVPGGMDEQAHRRTGQGVLGADPPAETARILILNHPANLTLRSPRVAYLITSRGVPALDLQCAH
ncbi:hypothetical protein M405DRAFT_838524 [Rhizopogon salebrosus TDB-379]|nr:hypothetical protein M405DRAFT_838524 [Rhizopogon salebrosus TDB-379]